ncbi:hypothetical protein CLI74_00260 [Porphyromonas gingivalis]|nr:hypothetical protein CS059_01990 [Porphyromonas gingivalis]PDP57850.1 hypothetical protein CLI74_00260 [Porphyromonas gingivalis]
MARDFFRFGAGSKKFMRRNEKLLVRVFRKTRATICSFMVRKSRTKMCEEKERTLLMYRLFSRVLSVPYRIGLRLYSTLFFAFVLNLHHVVSHGRKRFPSPIDSKPQSR